MPLGKGGASQLQGAEKSSQSPGSSWGSRDTGGLGPRQLQLLEEGAQRRHKGACVPIPAQRQALFQIFLSVGSLPSLCRLPGLELRRNVCLAGTPGRVPGVGVGGRVGCRPGQGGDNRTCLRAQGCIFTEHTIIRDAHTRACVLSGFSHVRFFAILRTVAHQAPLSMEFSRQACWGELHALLQGISPT